MTNDDLIKCPLCGGFTHVDSPDLLAALRDPRLREQVEQYVQGVLKSPAEDRIPVGATHTGRDFQKDVHSWNPFVPMWQRSPKE